MSCVRFHFLPRVAALYYALLASGYDAYAPEKAPALLRRLEAFRADAPPMPTFFRQVRQPACAVYPYWPRASLLETATIYLDDPGFPGPDYRNLVSAATNLTNADRDDAFWAWVREFPSALSRVQAQPSCRSYLAWAQAWLLEQAERYRPELGALEAALRLLSARYGAPSRQVLIALDPIKCAYSADYQNQGEAFTVIAGSFQPAVVLHEQLHPRVRPLGAAHRRELAARPGRTAELDPSYHLQGEEAGLVNAFEELFVRRLTAELLAGRPPASLSGALRQLLAP